MQQITHQQLAQSQRIKNYSFHQDFINSQLQFLSIYFILKFLFTSPRSLLIFIIINRIFISED